MTRDDLRIFCTVLAFTGLMLKGENGEHQSDRIKDFAKLIEAFCFEAALEALGADANPDNESDPASIDLVIDIYKAQMRDKEPFTPPIERVSLLKIFDRLHQRQQRRRQRHFYATGDNEAITNRVAQLIREEIEADGAVT